MKGVQPVVESTGENPTGLGLEYDSAVPLYHQLKELLAAEIENLTKRGLLHAGAQFATEKDLQARFSVSRATVRQAISGLVREGLLVSKRGRGTFVGPGRVYAEYPYLSSLSEEAQSKGLHLTTKVLKVSVKPVPVKAEGVLGAAGVEKCLHLTRLRLVDGEPVFIFDSYLPSFLGVDPKDDFTGSLYALLEGKYGVRIAGARVRIGAGAATPFVASHLKVRVGTPVIVNVRVAYDEQGRVVEYIESVARADRCQHEVELRRKGGVPGLSQQGVSWFADVSRERERRT